MAENLTDLQKQKEDIQILLSTLEEAFRDASITEEHYNEVKGKNQSKLEELDKRIAELEKQSAAPAAAAESAPEKEPEEPKKGGRPRKPKPPSKPSKKGGRPRKSSPAASPQPSSIPATPSLPSALPPATPDSSPAAMPPATPGAEAAQPADYSGVPQPLTDVAGADDAAETRPDKAPGGARRFAQPGTVQYTAGEIKEMLGKIIKEIKPQGIEVMPRVDKIEVDLEKVRAYIEAMKDERSGGTENVQRMNEELGEVRSNVSNIDRKVSEAEMKVQEISEAIGDLRPKRFIKALEEEDKSIRMHDARLDKLDDLNSVMLKRLGQIEEVLKRLGSLEKIVSFSKEAAKRLLEIENREKRINRIADKIDGIFMDLNKRLDEFVLYKAKQDTLDELSQEMMKSLDGLSTKIENYASKSDLDMLKEMIETEISSIRTSSGTSPAVQKLQEQKTEIEGLIAMLDEQFKAGALPEKEYKKTKQINQERLADLDRKIAGAQSGEESAPAAEKSPDQWASEAKPESEASPASQQGASASEPPGQNASGQQPPPAQPNAETPESPQAPPGASSPEPMAPDKQPPGQEEPVNQSAKPGPLPGNPAGTGKPPVQQGLPPAQGKPAQERTAPPAPSPGDAESGPAPLPHGTTPDEMRQGLEDSHERGLIGKEALEKTRSLIGGAKGLFRKRNEEAGSKAPEGSAEDKPKEKSD